jgi:type I restriction enzyme, R subunit
VSYVARRRYGPSGYRSLVVRLRQQPIGDLTTLFRGCGIAKLGKTLDDAVHQVRVMRAEHERGANLGLRDDELAFYDAVCQNDSAALELSDDTLKAIARELVSIVRRNTTVDWDKKEQVRASLRRHVRRLLTKYKYPPDKQESAVLLVIQQAELIAAERAA